MAGPLTYIPSTFNPAFSPTASGISPAGGPFTVTITPPVLDMQFIYPAVYITVTAPPLASLAGAISTFAVNGVTPSGGVNAFLPTQPAPLVGTPPVFQIQPQNVGVLTVNILLFGGVIVDAKPIFAPYSIATAWNGPMGTAFAAPITMPFSVAFEGWPDGAQASVTLCTWEHPQLQELRRMIMPAAA
jgi:hypothetical protein